ncbi:MAG: ATP-binding cassette domain-containing protein [Planctomycetota bacterium]|nr:MAG: ATP-binding cassette domain-containing protein [Planctomycetota bacterium]
MTWSGIEVRLRIVRRDFELDVAFESMGRAVGLFGPSGAGKTTILEAIAGWRVPRDGFVRVGESTLLDTAHGRSVPVEARGVGYLPQDDLLFPHWTVRENIRAGIERAARRGDDAGTFERAVHVLELAPLLERRPATLSGGELRRVGLARAICSGPTILLLDEPLGALDLELRRRILPYLVRVREEFDVPVVLVTHDATEVHALCDHAIVIEGGRVRASGSPAAVLSGPALHATEFENVLRGEALECEGGTALVRVGGGALFRIPRAGLEAGDRVLFGLRAADIVLATAPVTGLSARNVLPARIESLATDRDDVFLLVRPDGDGSGDAPLLWVSLTTGAVQDLALTPGGAVHLVVKTQSCHRLA